jgi:hypothetical protein
MMLRVFTVLALAAVASASWAQTFAEYMKLRKQYGITQAVGIPALETFVGKRTMEVKGVVKGTITAAGKAIIFLDRGDGEAIHVQTASAPDWLQGNQVGARLLIRAERDSDVGELRAWLIGAATEEDVADVEAKLKPKPKPATSRSKTVAVRKPSHTPAKEWSLPASQVTPIYAQFIKSRNGRLSDAEATKIATGIVGFSILYGVDARLIMAMVMAESGFNPSATSRAGAMGLGQLMPGTAKGMGLTNAYDSIQNLYATVRIVRGHLERYGKKVKEDFEALILALAAYNSGSGAVRRHNGVPPYQETQNYIRKVIGLYRAFTGR